MAEILEPEFFDAIKNLEGWTPKATWDYQQYSNGYGTRAAHPGETIDRATAETRLGNEVQKAAGYVDDAFPGLTGGKRAALISLTYNSGPGWINAGLGDAVRSGNWNEAQARFTQYNKAGGQYNEGLANRRAQEVAWFDGSPSSTPSYTSAPQGKVPMPGMPTIMGGDGERQDMPAILGGLFNDPMNIAAMQMIVKGLNPWSEVNPQETLQNAFKLKAVQEEKETQRQAMELALRQSGMSPEQARALSHNPAAAKIGVGNIEKSNQATADRTIFGVPPGASPDTPPVTPGTSPISSPSGLPGSTPSPTTGSATTATGAPSSTSNNPFGKWSMEQIQNYMLKFPDMRKETRAMLDKAYEQNMNQSRLLSPEEAAQKGLETTSPWFIDKEGKPFKPTNPAIDDMAKLRTEFNSQPNVKKYQESVGAYQSMFKSASLATRASDLDLVNGLAKLLDPTSSVREGEFATVMKAQDIPERIKGYVQYLFQGEGQLTPEARREMMEIAHNRTNSYREEANTNANRYREIASSLKLHPDVIAPKGFPEIPKWEPKKAEAPTGTPTKTTAAAPIRVNTPEEARKLKSGTRFIIPDGSNEIGIAP